MLYQLTRNAGAKGTGEPKKGADGGLFSFGSGAQYFGSLPDQSVGPFAVVEDVVAVTASYALSS